METQQLDISKISVESRIYLLTFFSLLVCRTILFKAGCSKIPSRYPKPNRVKRQSLCFNGDDVAGEANTFMQINRMLFFLTLMSNDFILRM